MTDPRACPDEFELCDLARGTISGARGVVLRDHIGDCAACRATVASLVSASGESTGDGAPGVERDSGRYELLRLLATGGMGEVFLARDAVLGREVAIKLLHEEAATPTTDSSSRRRLSREARALASLAHPNVVAVYDQGVLDGRAFLAMEYVRGRTLRQWIAGDEPDLERLVDVLVQAGRGLLAAHEIGVVHRDFKPDNVLVGDDGRARVTDFGMAGAPLDLLVAVDGAISGTPAYMAPEQLAGKAVDAQSDQYAFCVTVHEAIHGSRPSAGRRPLASGGAPRDRRLARIDRVLSRGLSVRPADRFASMRDVLRELEAARTTRTRVDVYRVLLPVAATVLLGSAVVASSVLPRDGAASIAPAGLHAPCGGASGECPSPLVCRYFDGNYCGAAGQPGTCGWPSDGCDAKSPAVCGCDGVSYENQCESHRAGASSAYRGACVECSVAQPCSDLTAGGKRTASFCHVEASGSAPTSGEPAHGVCWPRPSACTSGGPVVCGWDGRTYESACEARRSGIDVEHDGACAEGPHDRASPPETPDETPIGPGGLAFGAPDEQAMDARPLVSLAEWIEREKLPIFSLLVSRNGVVVFELYTSRLTRDDAHYLMGATGAVTSSLVGVAIDRHLVGGLETPVADALPAGVFPDRAARERFRGVTIRDVLAMSALDAPVPPHDSSEASRARLRLFLASPNRTRFALGQALVSSPGKSFAFTDITPQIATGIVEYATRRTALQLAEETLFLPMGFRNYEWMHQDRAGIDNGAYGLRLRPVDMQKLGVLYLREGQWEDRRLLSRAWVATSFSPWIRSSERVTQPNYGGYFWTIDYGAPAALQPGRGGSWVAHVATGWKGQRLAVFVDEGVVVTMTGALEPPEDDAEIFRRVVQDYVRPSIDGTGAEPAHPDAGSRRDLADALERIRNETPVRMQDLETRMVPSIAPKERHRGFQPD